MPTALEGTRVIDLSRLAPGPFCTMLLSDLGADVVRVEQPPANSSESDSKHERRRAAFNALNRNKRSIALDLKTQGGQEVLRDLL